MKQRIFHLYNYLFPSLLYLLGVGMRHMVLLVLCVITSVFAVAQNKGLSQRIMRHEVTLGLGWGSLMQDGRSVWSFYDDDGHNFPMGNLHLQYLYNVNRHIGFGGLLDLACGYREVREVHYSYDEKDRVIGGHSKGVKKYTEWFTLSPAARFYWFNNKNFAMYSRVGVGVVFGVGQDNGIAVMPNLSPISMEFGGPRRRFCTELLAIGSYGLLNGGLKYSF